MEFSLSFKTGNKNKEVNKSDVVTPIEWGKSWFYELSSDTSVHTEVLTSMYRDLPELQIPINYALDKLANIPFWHYKKGAVKDTLIENSKYLDILDNPNQYQRYDDYIKAYFLNRFVLGVSFINRVKPVGFGFYKQLYILPSGNTKANIYENSKNDPRQNIIKSYTTNWGGGELELISNEVVVNYEANLDPSPVFIRSRLCSAIESSKTLRAIYQARIKTITERGAMGIISPKENGSAITKEDAITARDEYNKETGITGKKAPIRVSPIPIEYTQIGFDIASLQLSETRKQDFNTMCNLMQIDPVLFTPDSASYNNKILAKRNFWEDVGMPQFNSFLRIHEQVFDFKRDEFFKADYSNIPALQEDYEKKVNANSKAWNDGIITEAEYREAIGYEGGTDSKKSNPQTIGSNGSA